MKALATQPRLVELVQAAILAEIGSGKLRPGARIVQEQIARQLGVSRQPVQQALLVLRNLGMLREAPGRGLQVAPLLDLEHVRHSFELRSVIEGLAFRNAAERNARRARKEGPALIQAGRKAEAEGNVTGMTSADIAFHNFVYTLSENPLVSPAVAAHMTNIQRIMGEVLIREDKPRHFWDQHEALLQALIAGDGEKAELLARQHIEKAADWLIDRIRREKANH